MPFRPKRTTSSAETKRKSLLFRELALTPSVLNGDACQSLDIYELFD